MYLKVVCVGKLHKLLKGPAFYMFCKWVQKDEALSALCCEMDSLYFDLSVNRISLRRNLYLITFSPCVPRDQ